MELKTHTEKQFGFPSLPGQKTVHFLAPFNYNKLELPMYM